MIDRNLNFNHHFSYIESKIDKMLDRIRRLIWMNSKIIIKEKMRLYHSVIVPTVIYAHQIWYIFIKNKVTYIDRLNRMQNKALRMITGAYKTTSINKLLEITGIIKLDQELQILCEIKKQLRNDIISNRSKYFNLDFQPYNLISKESIWCLTKSGPFNDHLIRFKLAENNLCRYCNYVEHYKK